MLDNEVNCKDNILAFGYLFVYLSDWFLPLVKYAEIYNYLLTLEFWDKTYKCMPDLGSKYDFIDKAQSEPELCLK